MRFISTASRTRGFTLIELVVTVTIVGILGSLAIPSLHKLFLTQFVRSGATDLQSSLFYARSEAIKRAADVQIVPVSSAWTSGWSVQLTDGTVLRKQNALSASLSSITGSTITYQLNGRVAAVPAQIVFKSADASIPARCVKVDLSGRPSVVYDTDGNNANGCN